MSKSDKDWYKKIRNEIMNRNEVCNKLDEYDKVYEYDRHNINPYDIHDLKEFKKKYPFDKTKNCKLLIRNPVQKTDKYKRYYKDVFTEDKCDSVNGFWNPKAFNRNNGYDLGNCWVEGNDNKCGSRLINKHLLRNDDYINGFNKTEDLKTAKKMCEGSEICRLKQTGEYVRDCVLKSKVGSKLAKEQQALQGFTFDINNLEKSLYDYFNNNPIPPETLELIGEGNRCIVSDDNIINDKDEIIAFDREYTADELRVLHVQDILKSLNPNTNDYIFKKFMKDELKFTEFLYQYNQYVNTDKKALNDIYRYYFPNIFKDIDFASRSRSISNSGSSIVDPKYKQKFPTVPQEIVNNICKLISSKQLNKKGLLLWHSTGSGKTCTASAIIDGFWNSDKKIIYCSSVDALVSNPPFKFHECCSNLFKRFHKKSLSEIDREFKNKEIQFLSFAKLANRIESKEINLNNCVLIIDEVHNLFRPLVTQKKQYAMVEKLLLSNKFPNLNVFILTATLGDNPSEIMKLLNIVKDNKTPEILFSDISTPDIFKEKIRGLISYFDMSTDTTKFPVVKDKDPQYYEMSLKQFEKYITAYKEVSDTAKNYNSLAKANSLNKYWASARRYSNMLYNYEEGLSLNEFSSKLPALLETINDHPLEKQYIYSAFYENRGYGGHGILAIAKELEKLGYERLTQSEAIKLLNDPFSASKKPRYILAITTQLGVNKGEELADMIRLFNSSINSHGEYVNLFLASQTFNEGLDLKAVRHIHIFEPLITWASDKQTIGRAARYCSHADLDKSEWDVTIHRYASDFPREIKDISVDEEESIDDIKDKIQELKDIDYKHKIKIIKEEIKKNKDKIKKLIKKPSADENSEISQLNDENDRLEKEIEDIKEKELVTKENIQKLTKKEKELQKKAKKPKIDATGVENIDKFIYEESIKKMQKILILYQLMKESAIDCLVLKKFHKNGNQSIQCQNY
jgi:hypothetical protein